MRDGVLMRAAASFLFGISLVASIGWAALGGGSLAGRSDSGQGFSCTVAIVTDGDTLRCAETGADGKQIRVRLSGIAARERDGTCTDGHPCPDASADAATAELERLVEGGGLSCRPVGSTYGRVAAFCTNAAGVDLSCAMVASGTAAKWERYWEGHRCR